MTITSIPASECEVELIFISSTMLMITPNITPIIINIAVIIEYFLIIKSYKKELKKMTDGHTIQNKYFEKGLTFSMLILSPKEYNIRPITKPTGIIQITSLNFISSIYYIKDQYIKSTI